MKYNWIKTTDRLPNKEDLKDEIGKGAVDNSHADCFIFIKGRVQRQPFNFHHQCWDDSDYDDYEYDATEPTHWILDNTWPDKPTD